MISRQFERLEIIAKGSGLKRAAWLCRCECGTEKTFSQSDLLRGFVKSCGCLKRDQGRVLGGSNRRHGHASHTDRSPEYMSWRAMHQRCAGRPEGHKSNKYYRDRGITVCQQRSVFEDFLEDMGFRLPGTTLDRINNNNGYEPGNCRWAAQQAEAL